MISLRSNIYKGIFIGEAGFSYWDIYWFRLNPYSIEIPRYSESFWKHESPKGGGHFNSSGGLKKNPNVEPKVTVCLIYENLIIILADKNILMLYF